MVFLRRPQDFFFFFFFHDAHMFHPHLVVFPIMFTHVSPDRLGLCAASGGLAG